MKFNYKNTSLISEEEIIKTAKTLTPYLEHLNKVAKENNYESDEASMNLPFDSELISKVRNLVDKKKNGELKYLIIIGIGGSNLGTKAFYDALYGFYDILQPQRLPKVIFLDTQDEEVLVKICTLIKSLHSKNEVLINAISKSGGTTETATNLEVVYKACIEQFGSIDDRIVITTDEGSQMQKIAEERKIDFLSLPKKVGGRFSVFSAVGMFPLAILGFNIEKIKETIQTVRDLALEQDVLKNQAVISASILYLHYKNGKNINDNFIFLPQLESMGKWYRQLMGESIGKDGEGITPTVSIGSTDLHSVGQLYLGGRTDKITTFIYGELDRHHTVVPDTTTFNIVTAIKGKSVHNIMEAIVNGTKIAYQKQQLPFTEIIFDFVSEVSIAEFMQFKMMEMMFLGKLIGVNTFDQPHVELYKVETKKILGS